MDSGQKPRKRDRITSLFKRHVPAQKPPSNESTSSDLMMQRPPPGDGDRERTRARYLNAVKLLEDAVKAYEGRWGSFDFPELKGEPKDFDDSLFRDKVNTVMDARKNEAMDQTAWTKCRRAIQYAFTAFSPFAKHFLNIVKEGQAVFAASCPSHL
jgi:hypothetical protein